MFYFMKVITLVLFWVEVKSTDSTLELLHVVFRHGERTPTKVELYQNSEYSNESALAPYGYGQLRNDGKRTMYNLGVSLRERYNDFIDASYYYKLIEATSSDRERTKDSLQLVLAGLFPVTEELSWNPGLNWTPIATYYSSRGDDKLLAVQDTEEYKNALEKFRQTEESKALAAPFKNLIDYYTEHTGEYIDFERLGYLTRGFEILVEMNLTLPAWIQATFPDKMETVISEVFTEWFGNTEIRKICGGPLLKKIIDDTEMKINKTLDPRRKLFLYSGHDYSVVSILTVLELWNKTAPSVGSYFIFEVHNINGTYGFKMLHSEGNLNEPQIIILPGFGEFVPFEDFKKDRKHFLDFSDESSLGVQYKGNLVFVLLTFSLFYQL